MLKQYVIKNFKFMKIKMSNISAIRFLLIYEYYVYIFLVYCNLSVKRNLLIIYNR